MRTPLQRLLQPRHIAMMGGREVTQVIQQCRKMGYPGGIWPINPKHAELAGLPCFASIAELPAAPDACFIAIPAAATVHAVAELAAKGAGGAVCYAAGFAEAGPAGELLQQQLLSAAKEMAIIGPNCYGLLNYLDRVALWPDVHGGKSVSRGVALITQSGNMGLNLTLQQRSLPIAYLISLGNSALVGAAELIRQLSQDTRVSAIGLHIEGLHDVPAFAAAADAARDHKLPLIALKTGRSAAGARTALSHTRSLAGADALYDALFSRCGIARVDTLPELLETLKFLHVAGPLPEPSIASLSCSGGEASLIADHAETLGLQFPELTARQRSELYGVLGERVALANPLDYHTYIWGNQQQQTACFGAVLNGPQAASLLIMDYPPAEHGADRDWLITEQAFCAARQLTGSVAAIASSLPENFPAAARERLLDQGIAPLQGLHEGLVALRAAAQIGGSQRRRPNPALLSLPAVNGRPTRLFDEWRSKRALAEFGIPLPTGQLCSADKAVEVAERLGYPLVLKAVSARLPHKTEAGAVILNLRSAQAVQTAADRLSTLSSLLLLERMIEDSLAELLVGVSRDGQFGLALSIGSGGIAAELVRDVRHLLLPCPQEDIRRAVLSLKLAPLLSGYRGRPAADLEAAVAAIQTIVDFALARQSTLLELDVNPLLVRPAGFGVVAADALLRCVVES